MLKRILIILSILILIKIICAQTIDTVFISASRISTNILDLPLSTSLILKKDIISKTNGDVASVFYGLAGIDTKSYSFINSAASISLYGSTSQQVLVLLDGLPINFASSGMPDLGLISQNNIERIEIVKGAISSVYGANALGGIINLITQDPYDISNSTSYQINYKFGSFNTYQFSFTDKIRYLSSIFNYFFLKSDGVRTNDDVLFQSANVISSYAIDSTTTYRLNLTMNSKELGLPGPLPDSSQHPLYGDQTAFSKYDRQKDILFIMKSAINKRINSRWNISVNTHYLLNNSNYLWINQWSLDTSLYNDYYQSKTFFINFINNCYYNQSIALAFGTDLEYNQFDAFTEYPSDTNWHPRINKFGIFAEGSFRYFNNIKHFISVRYDYNSSFGYFVSPSTGLNTNLTDNFKLRAHFGQAYRAPSMNDLYWPISGNKRIKPEIGNTLQIGFDYIMHQKLFVSLTSFNRITRDLINWLPDTSNVWRPTNIDSSKIFGLELTTKINLFENLQIVSNFTTQKAEQIKKELIYYDWLTQHSEYDFIKRQQAFVPKLNLSFDIHYQLNLSTKIMFYGNYVSSRINYYVDYSELPNIKMKSKTLPAHFVLSGIISKEINKYFKLKFKVDNIFNSHYAEQFGNSIIDKDYPRSPRTLFVEMELSN